jgi:O-succinylhomoserine sulfhydrylase
MGNGMKDRHFETEALHAGYEYAEGHNIFPPIHMGVAFPFESGAEAARICSGEQAGYVYARTGNPTNTILEQRLAALEGAEDALATSSGLAAVFETVLELMAAEPGEFVTSSRLYGNTQNQFRVTLPGLGIRARWVERPDDIEAWEDMITSTSRFLFAESPSNPDTFVADIEQLGKLAKAHRIPLVIDSTLSSPAMLRPLELGASIVIHSTTKYLSGHSAALGGVILGKRDFVESLRSGHHHYIGPTMSPFNAWLTLIGVETLSIRMERCIRSAQRIAEFLDEHPLVEQVNYPGLPSHPQHKIALKQTGGGGTSLLSFTVRGGAEGAWRVIKEMQIPCHATHLGSNQTVAVHPASTTHGKLTPQQRAGTGVPDGLIRYSVGLEDPDDLVADLDQALRASSRTR